MKFATMSLILACAGYAASSCGAESAQADVAQARQIVTKICAACHGNDGNSVSAANPILAGQHADYVSKQLANYKSGERKNPVMQGMAAPLSPAYIKNLAAYFEAQKPKARAATNPELVKLGQQIYRGGIANKGIAACASCHGPNGSGIPGQFPRVAGQYAEYTTAQLLSFRAGERANDPNKMMATTASKMSDQEIKAVAEYMAGLR